MKNWRTKDYVAAIIIVVSIVISIIGAFMPSSKTNNDLDKNMEASKRVQKINNQNKLNELNLTEKKKVSDEIRDILKNGNAKISVENKEYYSNKGGLFSPDYNGSSQEFSYYYSNSITRNMTCVSFFDSISFKRGDSNYGSFIFIKPPVSCLTTFSLKYEKPIGWDTIVFGNETDSYVFFAKDKKKVTNPKRGLFCEEVYLDEDTEKCYKILLGTKPYICFLKGNETLAFVKIHDDYKDDKKMLDAMYDVVRLIPKINFLKNENGKAYLY